MFKKLKMIGLMIFCGGMLTGCMQTVDMTGQESNMIAESMAGILLKYDKTYEGDLIYQESKDLRAEIESKEKKSKDLEVTTLTTGGQKANKGKNKSNSDDMVTSGKKAGKTSGKTGKSYNLNETIGNKDFKVSFQKYETSKSYHGNISNQAFSIDASDKNQLLIAYFDITNLTKTSQNFNLINSGLEYHLQVDKETTYKPLITLLVNDIQYINLDFAAKETKEAVILFEIPKDIDLSNVEMIVSNKDNSLNVNMK
nr:hypothetical protein [uncultured Anaerocolumna sp.]